MKSNHLVGSSFWIDSMHIFYALTLLESIFTNLRSQSYLFFVSTLHSSQNTRLSLDLGSECLLKHYNVRFCWKSLLTVLQMLCPQTSVNAGSFRNSRQDKHERTYSTASYPALIFSIADSNPLLSVFNLSQSSFSLLYIC